jgi:hypothetical protein
MKPSPFALLLLPLSKVIFFVRQNPADATPLTVVMDNDDETILASGDVEDGKLTNLICTAEEFPHVGKIPPASRFNGPDPMP